MLVNLTTGLHNKQAYPFYSSIFISGTVNQQKHSVLISVIYFDYFLYQFSGLGLSLNRVGYSNNSIVTITDIGTGSSALICTTSYRNCCFPRSPETQWYFPNGSQIPNNPNLPFRRNRGTSPGRMILSHNSEGTTTGIFHCDILDANNVLQSIYVGIYTGTTGKFYMSTE